MKKGQTLIFEQVMLFAISVTIFLISFAVFNIYQNYFVDLGSENQLDEAKEWIATHILKVAQKENATTLITIPVPREIGAEVYEITLTQAGLNLTSLLNANNTVFANLYTLNQTYSLSGQVNSIKGKVTIKKENNQITIV